MKYIFRSSIDIDHKDWKPGQKGRVPVEWVQYRLDLFHKFTLPSILNQTEQDFDIWVFCGQCYKHITSAYDWHPRVKVIHDMDKFLMDYLARCEEDYLTIGRIDSDDLYHKDALKVIKETQNRNPNELTSMAFRKVYSWDKWSNVLGKYHQSHPPQFVHTIPKTRYKDLAYFKKFHLTKHVGGSHGATALPEYHFCETRHNQSWTIRKRHAWSSTYEHDVVSEDAKQHGLKSRKFFAIDKDGLYGILKDFGVKRELI